MSKILFLNRLFGPDTEATGSLLTELAEDLAVWHEVTVICGPDDNSRLGIWPLIHRESYGAVRLVRTFGLTKSHNRRGFRHLNRLIYFALAWIAALRERPDVLVAETDPPMLGMLGAACKFIRNCRFVYYCQDVYPEVAQATGGLKNPALLWLLQLANQFAFRRADAIVGLSEDMARLLRRKAVPADKIIVIPNWIDCDLVKPQAPGQAWLKKYCGNFVVMYAGNLGWTQNLESVLEAADLLQDNPQIKFVFVGDGARKKQLQQEAARRRLTNLDFVDRVNPTAMSEVLAAADLHLIPLGAGVAGTMVPSKLYGILAAGKPFVAMMENEAEVARVAREFEVGFVVPPRDVNALTKTILQCLRSPELLTAMGRRARVLAEQKYSRRLVTRDFAHFLETTLKLPAAPRLDDENDAIPEIERIASLRAD
jgi:colanic acid biosynthesis glycosyl transferase WcaI